MPWLDGTSTPRTGAALELELGGYVLDGRGVVGDGVTDNAPTINALLVALGTGTAVLSSNTNVYGVKSPVIVPSGVTLRGVGAMQGGTTIKALGTFPTTTISGSQTLPADTTTPFTLTVASTAGFPLGSGGITPPAGTSVLCVAGLRIFYTGTTSTTFTGCRIGGDGVSVTLADTRAVSTPVVWLNDPAGTGGFGTRIDDLAVDCSSIAGSGGVHSCHIQEGGGWSNIRVLSWKNFAFAIDDNPAQGTTQHSTNYEWGKVWSLASATAEAESVGIDIMHSFVGAAAPRLDSDRGGFDASFVVQGNANVIGKAAIRLNGVTGHFGRFHPENQHVGVLIGDLYRCDVIIDGVQIGSLWGSNTNDAAVQIGAIAGNNVDLRQVRKANAANLGSRKVLADLTTGFTSVAETIDYNLYQSGCYRVSGGELTGVSTSRPAAALAPATLFYATDTGHFSVSNGSVWRLITPDTSGLISLAQDNVAAGARDNSSASTLVATFTKATLAGHTLLLAAGSSGNFTLSSVADSRGNSWSVDATHQGQGVSANIARCPVTIPHQIGDTLTLTFGGASTYAIAIVSDFSGILVSSPLDITKGNNGSSGTPTTQTTTTPRTQPDELIYGACAYNNATPLTAGAGYTALTTQASGAGNRRVTPEYQVVSAVGSDAATWVGTPGAWEAILATYKAAVGTV